MDVSWIFTALVVVGVLAAIGLVGYLFVKLRWKIAGPEEALVISGRSPVSFGRGSEDERDGDVKIVRGGGRFVWPGWQAYQKLSLQVMTMQLSVDNIYSKDNILLSVAATAQVKIGGTRNQILSAAECFLGMPKEKIQERLEETVEGHLRSIVGTRSAIDLYQQQQQVQESVRTDADPDLAGMGCEIKSFTFKRIDDSQGYFKSLGEPEVQEAQRKAREATAEANEQATIREEAARLTVENRKLEVDREVLAEREKFQLREQEVAEQVNRATARAERERKLEETKRDIEIAEKEAERMEKHLEATIREQARAARYATEQNAAAERVRREEAAAAERAEGSARAEVRRLEGEAEADAVRALGLAEAEARRVLAEALNSYKENAKALEVIKVLPEVVAAASEPLARASGATTIITGGNGNGNGTGASRFVGDLAESFPQYREIFRALGLNVDGLLDGVARLPGAVADNLEHGLRNVASEDGDISEDDEVSDARSVRAATTS